MNIAYLALLLNCLPFAGPGDSTVEIRLEILQQTGGTAVKNLALGISIINHTDRDVYISGLILDSCLSLCREREGVFVPDTLRDYREEFAPPLFLPTTNEITGMFPLRSDILFTEEQKNPVLTAYCRTERLSLKDWLVADHYPLFLKAHQRMDKAASVGLNHILKRDNTLYRIRFAPRTPQPAFTPREIMGYALVKQAELEVNTLYYHTLPLR